jgi:hypothetical protein
MFKFGQCVLAAAAVLYCHYELKSAYDITSPTANEQLFDNSNVLTRGHSEMGKSVFVKLKEGGVNTGWTTDKIAVGAQSVDWEKSILPPPELWTVSDDWKCHLYDWSTQQEVGTAVPYKVVAH